MHAWTGEERWATPGARAPPHSWRRRDADGLWTQRGYGGERRGLRCLHGVAGNVAALLGGDPLLDAGRPERLHARLRRCSRARPSVEDGAGELADGGRQSSNKRENSVQWCHGAPGIVATAADYLDEELLLAGAELPWRAGPFGREKGAGICHGTAGNGYAFLKAFERTGDERWLERARRFAVHALEQVSAEAAAVATRSGRATSASPSSRPTASKRARAIR